MVSVADVPASAVAPELLKFRKFWRLPSAFGRLRKFVITARTIRLSSWSSPSRSDMLIVKPRGSDDNFEWREINHVVICHLRDTAWHISGYSISASFRLGSADFGSKSNPKRSTSNRDKIDFIWPDFNFKCEVFDFNRPNFIFEYEVFDFKMKSFNFECWISISYFCP